MAGPFPYIVDDLVHPAPGCPVIVSYDTGSRALVAILDTGADFTSIPIDLANELALRPEGDIEVLGATGGQGGPELQVIYLVNLEFPTIPQLTVAAHPVLGGTGLAAREYVFIGRDILKKHHLALAGPKAEFFVD
ncbi:MAG TPA: hypothetical protein VI756_11850 [Blastocatellia bacterium]